MIQKNFTVDPTNEVLNHPELMMHVNPAYVMEGGDNLVQNVMDVGGAGDFEAHQIAEYLQKAKDIDWSQDYKKFVLEKNLHLGQLEGFVRTQRKIGLSSATVDFNKFDDKLLNEKQGDSYFMLTSWSDATVAAEANGTDPPDPIHLIIQGKLEQ